jgi:beta-glucosidase
LKVQGSGKGATVSFTVKNTGKVAGAEVAQVYINQPKSALPRPEKELKAFEKVVLQPGQQKTVTIPLKEEAFQYYNDVLHKWVMEPGTFNVLVGSSSRDIRLTNKVSL